MSRFPHENLAHYLAWREGDGTPPGELAAELRGRSDVPEGNWLAEWERYLEERDLEGFLLALDEALEDFRQEQRDWGARVEERDLPPTRTRFHGTVAGPSDLSEPEGLKTEDAAHPAKSRRAFANTVRPHHKPDTRQRLADVGQEASVPKSAPALGEVRLDTEAASAFCRALAGDGAGLTLQTFDDHGSDRRLARVFHGFPEEHAAALERLQEQGAGVFVTVNQTNGRGRGRADMVGARAIWGDFDTPEQLETLLGRLPLTPSAVVESSPAAEGSKHHVYYFLAEDVAPAVHAQLLQAVVDGYGADNGAKGFNRVLRLPGSLHLKGEPFRVRVVEGGNGKRYTLEELQAAFPAATEPVSIEAKRQAVIQSSGNTPRPVRLASGVIETYSIPAYVRDACEKEIHALATYSNPAQSPSGGPSGLNDELTRRAPKLGSLDKYGSREWYWAVLDAVCAQGMKRSRALDTLSRQWAFGAANPRHLVEVEKTPVYVLEAQARAEAEVEHVAAAEAAELMRGRLAEHDGSKPLVLATTVGTGKTRTAAEVVAGREAVVYVTKSHRLAGEFTGAAEAHGATTAHHRGILSIVDEADGNPICQRAEEAREVLAAGGQIRRALCPSCPHKDNCAALREVAAVDDNAAVHVGPVELLAPMLERASGPEGLFERKPLVVFDESPPLLEESKSWHADDIRRAIEDLEAKKEKPSTVNKTPLAQRMLGRLLAFVTGEAEHPAKVEPDTWDEDREALRSCAVGAPGALKPNASIKQRRGFLRMAGVDALIRHACADGATFHVEAKELIVSRRADWLDHLAAGGVLLDADAPPALEALVPGLEVERVSVEEGAKVQRVALMRSHASRKSLCPGQHPARPNWPNVDPMLRDGLQAARELGARRVVVFTFKPVADGLRDKTAPSDVLAHLEGFDEVAVEYFGGASRGTNAYEDFDAVVTVGDAWPNLGAVQRLCAVAGIDGKAGRDNAARGMAEAELGQCHGRIRAVHRHGVRLAQIHVGGMLPSSWRGRDFEMRRTRAGRKANDTTACAEVAELVAALGGQRAAAAATGLPRSSLQRWAGGNAGPSAEGLARLREVAHQNATKHRGSSPSGEYVGHPTKPGDTGSAPTPPPARSPAPPLARVAALAAPLFRGLWSPPRKPQLVPA